MNEVDYFQLGPANLAVFIHRSILKQLQPIRVVTHDWDGSWSFFDGGPITTEGIGLVALEQALTIDPTVRPLGLLKPGQYAERTEQRSPWAIEQLEADEETS